MAVLTVQMLLTMIMLIIMSKRITNIEKKQNNAAAYVKLSLYSQPLQYKLQMGNICGHNKF